MSQEKTKVYIYTRVSTTMQIDGYSLDAQKARMKAYADFNDYQIVGGYEDAGKSGKSIEGRASFCRMMEDIKSGKDGVSYVLVFKLSRFGRNAADVLSTLQVMQDFGVNLISVDSMAYSILMIPSSPFVGSVGDLFGQAGAGLALLGVLTAAAGRRYWPSAGAEFYHKTQKTAAASGEIAAVLSFMLSSTFCKP